MSFLNKFLSIFNSKKEKIKTKEEKEKNEWDLTSSLTLYKEFIDNKYYSSPDHSIPSGFIARCVKADAIWLVNLLIGIAFYSIKFDSSTESFFTPELLKRAGYKDPCVEYGLVKKEWTQKTSIGKNPIDPKTVNEFSGLGIANYDASGLLDFYTGEKLTATLPKREKNKELYDLSGDLITEVKEVIFNNESISGWGLSYGDSILSLDTICWNPKIASIKKEKGKSYLYCTKPNDLNFKCIGSSIASKNLPSQDREVWYRWSRYYLTGEGAKITNNVLFPAAKWFCSYWSPYYAWGKDNKMQVIDQIMMLSAIANSSPSLARKILGKSVDEMIKSYATNTHRKRRAYNTLRAITIIKYLKSVEY